MVKSRISRILRRQTHIGSDSDILVLLDELRIRRTRRNLLVAHWQLHNRGRGESQHDENFPAALKISTGRNFVPICDPYTALWRHSSGLAHLTIRQ